MSSHSLLKISDGPRVNRKKKKSDHRDVLQDTEILLTRVREGRNRRRGKASFTASKREMPPSVSIVQVEQPDRLSENASAEFE